MLLRGKLLASLLIVALLLRGIEGDSTEEDYLEKCCDLGSSWASQKLRCEKFTGPVSGVEENDQAACLETVEICCSKAFQEQGCQEGKADAKAGLACTRTETGPKKAATSFGDYKRDCCEGCKLGILTGSSGKSCVFKKFSLGIPWDPAFVECCNEALTSTTTRDTTSSTRENTSTISTSSTTEATSESDELDEDIFNDLDSTTFKSADDLCQLMKGLLCSEICVSTPGSYYCKCHEGSTLQADKRTCKSNLTTTELQTTSSASLSSSTTPIFPSSTLPAEKKSLPPMLVASTFKILTTAAKSRSTRSAQTEDNELNPPCPPGYRYSPATEACEDIDECSDGSHNCGEQKCYNLPGSFHCAQAVVPVLRKKTTVSASIQTIPGIGNCKVGSRLDPGRGGCIDVNECEELEDACSSNEECVNTPGSFQCTCLNGFRRDELTQACVDINECQLQNDCLASQRCDNTIGSYTCVRFLPCGTGYTLNAATEICEDDDECLLGTHDCSNGYHCKNTIGSYRCIKDRKKDSTLPTTTRPTARKTVKPTWGPTSTIYTTPRSTTPRLTTSTTVATTTTTTTTTTSTTTPRPTTTSTQRTTTTIKPTTTSTSKPTPIITTTPRRTTTTQRMTTTPKRTTTTPRKTTTTQRKITTTPRRTTTTPKIITTRRAAARFVPTTTTTEEIPTVGSLITTTPRRKTTIPVKPKKVLCPNGFEIGSVGQCIDINECHRNRNMCGEQHCINTLGSYRCEPRLSCGFGYALDAASSQCKDVDECSEGTHKCGSEQICENRPGGYVCYCRPGYEIGSNRNNCIDINECDRAPAGRSVCGSNSRCVNSPGSFHCLCDPGFENDRNGGCDDVDECRANSGNCQQECYNTWGGHKCGCNYGYRLKSDNRTCEDVDECSELKGNNLCIGICENTHGSYVCRCPEGYKLADDTRTCQDIDECSNGSPCRVGELCQNTRGGYKCNRIDCPDGYVKDPQRKNRCVRESMYCPVNDLACFQRPAHYTFNFIAIVSMYPIPVKTGQVELFTMRGAYNLPGATVRFSIAFIKARAPPHVIPATESCFALRRPFPSQAVLVMVQSLQGPQDIELEFSMEIYSPTGAFAGSAVAKVFIVVTQYEF